MTIMVECHEEEGQHLERAQFGKFFRRFLRNLTVPQIKFAEGSLKACLHAERLEGRTFLDIGSGSGLSSLAARRLGTMELRRRFFNDDKNWKAEQGSILDNAYLGSLGVFDVVYSWGTLHHTGAMWQALENLKPLVDMGGNCTSQSITTSLKSRTVGLGSSA